MSSVEDKKKKNFPGQVKKVTKRNTVFDGKSSMIVADEDGNHLFWYEANAIAYHEQVTKELDKHTFVDEKSFYNNPPTHQKLWFAPPDFAYHYSGETNEPIAMPDCLVRVQKDVMDKTNDYAFKGIVVVVYTYPGTLANKYRKSSDSVGWHADSEAGLLAGSLIAGVSTGVAAKFQFRIKKGLVVTVHVQPGSIYWFSTKLWHRVPKDETRKGVRYNATFREPSVSADKTSKKRKAEEASASSSSSSSLQPLAKKQKI